MGLIALAEAIGKLFYLLTAYLPRRLPSTPEQYERFKNVLIHCYGVTDEPKSWITVAGQIHSTPATQLRKSWGSIANAAKRLSINELAHSQADASRAVLQEKMAGLVKTQNEITEVIEAEFKITEPRFFLAEEDTDDLDELVGILMEKFPDKGNEAEWGGFVKQLAASAVAKLAKEQANGNQDGQKQQAQDGNAIPQTPDEYAKKVQ